MNEAVEARRLKLKAELYDLSQQHASLLAQSQQCQQTAQQLMQNFVIKQHELSQLETPEPKP